MSKLDTYFANKGIKTVINCLGHNENLVRSYVSNYYDLVNNSTTKQSQHVKLKVYNDLFVIQPRNKKTGFEKLKSFEKTFKNKIQNLIVEPQNGPLMVIQNSEKEPNLNYKQTLLNFVNSIENPLLYLSGGADSEVVANAFLKTNKKFQTVIFEWLDNQGQIINTEEVFHAYRFCKNNGIVPIIKQVNLENLWNTNEFEKLAIDIQLISPQLVTYAYMINLMASEYPNMTHVHGGEVRFKTNYYSDSNTVSNLVYLDKVTPAYNGQTYDQLVSGTDAVEVALNYNGTLGTWEVVAYWDSFPSGTPLGGGTWTNTPASQYEYSITSVTPNFLNGSTQYDPNVPLGYSDIIKGGTTYWITLCYVRVNASGPGQNYTSDVTFGIDVRVTGQVSPLTSTTINLIANNDST